MRNRNLGSGLTVCRHCETNRRKGVVHEGAFEDGGVAFASHLFDAHPEPLSCLIEQTRERLLARTPAEMA